MEDCIEQTALCIAEANAIAKGIAMSLDCMEGELGKDARFYALRACIGEILEKSGEAAEALDMFTMEQSRSNEA